MSESVSRWSSCWNKRGQLSIERNTCTQHLGFATKPRDKVAAQRDVYNISIDVERFKTDD